MIGGLGGRSQSCSDEQPLRMAFRKYTFAWHLYSRHKKFKQPLRTTFSRRSPFAWYQGFRIQDQGSQSLCKNSNWHLGQLICYMYPTTRRPNTLLVGKVWTKNVVINFLPTYPPQPLAPLDQFLFLLMNWTIVHCPWRIFCHVEKFWDVEI